MEIPESQYRYLVQCQNALVDIRRHALEMLVENGDLFDYWHSQCENLLNTPSLVCAILSGSVAIGNSVAAAERGGEGK